MSWFPRPRDLALWPVVFALLHTACSRPVDTAQPDRHQVPFREGENAQNESHPDDRSTPGNNGLRPGSGLPFRDLQSLPAGTLLTVRLKNELAVDDPDFHGIFDAVVGEAVLVEGNEVVLPGTSVAGRVESARTSGLRINQGYVRLALDSIHMGGRELPIQTSSLFVHGRADVTQTSVGGPSQPVVRLESGRRLTFRLTEPVFIADPPDTPVR